MYHYHDLFEYVGAQDVYTFNYVHVECDGKYDSNGNCLNGFALPDCCDCPPGRTEDNGLCSEFKCTLRTRTAKSIHLRQRHLLWLFDSNWAM